MTIIKQMNNFRISSIVLIFTLTLVNIGCKDEGDIIEPVTLISITTTGIDVTNGSIITLDMTDSPRVNNVVADPLFKINFSKELMTSTVEDNIILSNKQDFLNSSIVTSGSEILLTPLIPLDTGIVYSISILSGLKATDGGEFIATSRAFSLVK
jgi:hypothetical protein